MKVVVSIAAFFLTLSILDKSNQAKDFDDLEKNKYTNFVTAIENESTFNYFTVIIARDINTGQTKEICTKGNFVLGALLTEMKMQGNESDIHKALSFAKSKKNRYFEFKNKKALENIDFYDYDLSLVHKIESENDLEKIKNEIKISKRFSMRLPDSEMRALAHVLFNQGFLTGENSCFGGALEYIK